MAQFSVKTLTASSLSTSFGLFMLFIIVLFVILHHLFAHFSHCLIIISCSLLRHHIPLLSLYFFKSFSSLLIYIYKHFLETSRFEVTSVVNQVIVLVFMMSEFLPYNGGIFFKHEIS